MKEENDSLTNIFSNFKKTWRYAKSYKKQLFGYLITTALISVGSAITPIYSAKIVMSITNGKFNELIYAAIITYLLFLFKSIIAFFASALANLFFKNILIDIQSDIAKETIKLETRELDLNSSGVFIDRINKDATELAEVFNRLSEFITEFFADIGILFAVFLLSKEIFIFIVITLILLFFINKKRLKEMYQKDKIFRELREKDTGLITELVRGIRDIKVLNASQLFISKTNSKLANTQNERYQITKISRKYNLLIEICHFILDVLFLILGIWLCNKNKLSLENFLIIWYYLGRIYNLYRISARLAEESKKFNLAANRVFQIIDNNKYQKEIFGKTHVNKIHGDFEFKNVNFAYANDIKVIKDLNFKINANETVAFVGKSGGGKTTIFSLLTKLYPVNKGKILIDGYDINDLTCESIRGNISIITQNPYIFNFSIKENLSIVKDDLTEEEMIEACKLACIHDYIMSLPEKYDTIVGEGGLTLSGGQRQRLAIARALIKKTEIILFDEATSALDNETQKNIQKAINNMKNEYTILIIAHRLSTIINSDRIIVIDKGSVIAEGNHRDLLKNCKDYQELYETELFVNNE